MTRGWLIKDKADDNRAKFWENTQTVKNSMYSKTSELQPVNLSEMSRDTAGMDQRVADSLQRF